VRVTPLARTRRVSCDRWRMTAPGANRRRFFETAGAVLASAAAVTVTQVPDASAVGTDDAVVRSPRPRVYHVDFTDPPTTKPFPQNQESRAVQQLCDANIVFLGEHRDSEKDRSLQVDILTRKQMLTRKKDLAIGLEQVEQRFQPVLDAYVARTVPDAAEAEAALCRDTEWDARWEWPFDGALPVLRLARQRGLPLLALGTDSEALFKVRREGLEGLTAEERNQYVVDFRGFIQFVKDPGFKLYAEKLIFPAYDQQLERTAAAAAGNAAGGRAPFRPSKQNFFAARILGDEAMASRAATYAADRPAGTLVILQGSDRVCYEFGSAARAERIARSFGGALAVQTVLLNPTAQESLSLTPALRLALAYGEDLYATRPLADYLWFSESPPVRLVPRMMPPDAPEIKLF
ncbi:unnamed protein product, partial [Phaeothamnion confervicola]